MWAYKIAFILIKSKHAVVRVALLIDRLSRMIYRVIMLKYLLSIIDNKKPLILNIINDLASGFGIERLK